MPSIFLLDTNIVSAVMADHAKVKLRLLSLSTGKIATSATVLGEIRYGLERLPHGKRRAILEAKASIVFNQLTIEPITRAAGDVYGTIRRAVELTGLSLGDNDLWIAAAALSLGAILVTNDQQLSHVPGLVVEDWTK